MRTGRSPFFYARKSDSRRNPLEIEFNWRTLVQVIAMAVLLLAGVSWLIRIGAGNNPVAIDHALTPTHPPAPQKTTAANIHIDFINHSAWQVNGADG